MKGIIMNTKKIYITPEINVMNIMTTYIMAGSGSTPGGGHSGLGGDNPEEAVRQQGGLRYAGQTALAGGRGQVQVMVGQLSRQKIILLMPGRLGKNISK